MPNLELSHTPGCAAALKEQQAVRDSRSVKIKAGRLRRISRLELAAANLKTLEERHALRQPPQVPSVNAAAAPPLPIMSEVEASALAASEGLTLAKGRKASGYAGVTRVNALPGGLDSLRPFKASVGGGKRGRQLHLGNFSSTHEAALAYARHLRIKLSAQVARCATPAQPLPSRRAAPCRERPAPACASAVGMLGARAVRAARVAATAASARIASTSPMARSNAPLAVHDLRACASSGRAFRLRAARHSRKERLAH